MRQGRGWQRIRPVTPVPVEDQVFNHLLTAVQAVAVQYQWKISTDLSLHYDEMNRPVWTRRIECRNLEYYSYIVCPIPDPKNKKLYVKYANRCRCGDSGQYLLTALVANGGTLKGTVKYTGWEEERLEYVGDFFVDSRSLNVYRDGVGKMGNGPTQRFRASLLA